MISEGDLETLLTELLEIYGYDFRSYTRASLLRRVDHLMKGDKIPSFAELMYRVRKEPAYVVHVVEKLTVNVTEMFRDPFTFRKIRDEVIPILATYPLIRIWHAGCSTGEEVYSMAILLHEANVLHKSLLYATDVNPFVVDNIQRGIFPLRHMQQYSQNYIKAGGQNDFSSYYSSYHDVVKFDERFRERIVSSTHNLVSDRSFNEFSLIICRNVLIYFNKDLQERVLHLFDASLAPLGFLVLGSKENIRFSGIAKNYTQLDIDEKIWRKTK